jgi:hypothetical protein
MARQMSVPRAPDRCRSMGGSVWRRLAAATAVPWVLASAPAARAEDSAPPIYLHRVGTGDLAGMKSAIEISVSACRAFKKLPGGGPVQMPPDAALAQVALIELEEYFDGAKHARYETSRVVWADPNSASCEVKIFHARHAIVEQMCGSQTRGATTLLGFMIDMEHPVPPNVSVTAGWASRAGCGRPARKLDLDGLPTESAGAARCVWNADIIAKKLRALGARTTGHQPGSGQADFCLYERRPHYVHDGHDERVVLKGEGFAKGGPLDRLSAGVATATNDRLVGFTDGSAIPAERFSEAALRAFVSQPAVTPVDVPR